MKDYNHKLLNGLTTFSLASILLSRFVIQSGALELASWIAFIVLEVSPKLSMLDADITKRSWWHYVVYYYELIVFNQFVDLDGDAVFVIAGLVGVTLYLRYRRSKKEKKEKAD